MEGYKDYLTHKALMMNVFQMALLKDIKDKMSEYYSENETMLISENNKRVSEQVKNEEAPFIFERLGCRYKHFFTDEFQDTSIMQWQNLMPLLVNGLSEGQRSLIVGDGKQAIYRFRQGDVEQFQHITTPPANATDVIKHHYKTIGANCTIEELDTNYRSAGNLVEFNNRFFTFLESQLYQQSPNHLMRDIYVGSNPDSPTLVQRVGPGKAGKGYVEVDLIEKERLANEAPRRIYDILCHLREAGYRYKDVAILSRTNGKLSDLNLRLMSINEQEGKLPDLQFSSADSLKLSQNPDSKFRLIAQSYILANLVNAANVHMRSLTDRYTRHTAPGQDLIILVEDAYQGGVRRPASTISGGESFLVSLALALALSEIGQSLKVETLFINEGFGTLSGEPLHKAINTLETLRASNNRQVYAISHRNEVKECIPVQIQVIQQDNKSCSKVEVVAG